MGIGPVNRSNVSTPSYKDNPASKAAAEAGDAERTARDRIQVANQQVQDYQNQAEERLDNLRKDYSSQEDSQKIRQEEALENQRLKGYQALRELQKQQQAEMNRVRREGDRDLTETKTHYENAIFTAGKQGDETLTQTLSKKQAMIDFENKTAKEEFDRTKSEQESRLAALKQRQDDFFTKESAGSQARMQKAQGDYETNALTAEARYRDGFQKTMAEHQASMNRLNQQTTGELERTRLDHSQKLAAYDSRGEDPFYRMVSFNARLDENDEAYVLRAVVPPHEREHIAVAVRGNQLVLSGARRNEERLTTPEDGKAMATSSYQSYSESYPLNYPVDARSMSREYDGDELVVTLPKANTYAAYKPERKKSAQPERARAERPKFPGNLPIAKNDKGSGTIS